MTQSKIIVDTNSYLRLAEHIRPLFKKPFGEEEYCLYPNEDLDKECSHIRLETKFPWIKQKKYKEDRKCSITISNEKKKEIEETTKLITRAYPRYQNVSLVDIRCLAYGYVLKIPVVTDDKDMIELANDLKDVKIIKTLELMKIMMDSNFIDMDDIKKIVEYWDYIDDLPANYKEDYNNLFNEAPPILDY